MNWLPLEFASLILPFASLFSKRTWHSVLVLVAGAILAPGKRTVSASLRVMGLSQYKHFQNYHRVLNPCSVVEPQGQSNFAQSTHRYICPDWRVGGGHR